MVLAAYSLSDVACLHDCRHSAECHMDHPMQSTLILRSVQAWRFPTSVCGLTGLRRLTLEIEGRKDQHFSGGSPWKLRRLSLLEELSIDASDCRALAP